MTTRREFLAGSSAAIVTAAAPRAAWSRTEVDVAIVGAGLAGLHAAKLCEDAGLSVVVLEGANRIGGRLYTLDDLPGAPDAGGIQIGAGYTRLHKIAGGLGVALSSDSGAGAGRVQTPGNLYWVNGGRSSEDAWTESEFNRLAEAERGTEPAALLRRYARALPALSQTSDWLTADATLDVSVAQALRDAGASVEAMRLIEANLNGNSLASMSQLHLARSFAIFRSQPGPISTVVGGAQRLPEAMANALSSDIRLGEIVTAISEDDSGVWLQTHTATLRAKHVICTIPFAAMRTMIIRSAQPAPVARMVAELPYTRASFAYISAKSPFWKSDGLPYTLWTDDPLLGRIFVLSDGSGEGPPMLKLWTTGSGADMLDRMAEIDATQSIVARIEKARPSAAGQLKVERLYSWQKSPFARGIYHHIGTGMARDLVATVQHSGRRLHFAGEHLAIASSGMEAALESGERAGQLVVERS